MPYDLLQPVVENTSLQLLFSQASQLEFDTNGEEDQNQNN